MTRTRTQKLYTSLIRVAAVATAILTVTVFTVGRSYAAFSATTSSSANSFSAGTVVLTDDDTGAAMFSATGMSPGNPVVECITVTYSGSLVPATVNMHGTTTGTLDTYLDLTIEEGTGGTFGDCTGFTPASTIFNNTLESFATTHTSFATGLAVFSPAANPTSRTLRFTLDVQDNNAAQGLSATADFVFEAQA